MKTIPLSILLLFSFLTLSFKAPTLQSPIMDLAKVIQPQDQERIERVIRALYREGKGPQLSVLVVDSLDGESIEDAAERTFNSWGLGSKEKDNGVLLMVAISDRKMRIETGYGLEGSLTDYEASVIINNMKPYFKAQDYGEGILQGIKEIREVIEEKNGVQGQTSYLAESKGFDPVAAVESPPAEAEVEIQVDNYSSSPYPEVAQNTTPSITPTELMVTLALIAGGIAFVGVFVFFLVGCLKARKETIDTAAKIKEIESTSKKGMRLLILEAKKQKEELTSQSAQVTQELNEASAAYRQTNHCKLMNLEAQLSQVNSSINSVENKIQEFQRIINRGL